MNPRDDQAASGGRGDADRDESGSARGVATAVTRSADTATIDITFKLYATLQDKLPPGTKRNATPIEVARDVTLNEIIDRFQVPRELAHLVLVNGHFKCEADRDARGTLSEGDVLAIWPPVAGG